MGINKDQKTKDIINSHIHAQWRGHGIRRYGIYLITDLAELVNSNIDPFYNKVQASSFLDGKDGHYENENITPNLYSCS